MCATPSLKCSERLRQDGNTTKDSKHHWQIKRTDRTTWKDILCLCLKINVKCFGRCCCSSGLERIIEGFQFVFQDDCELCIIEVYVQVSSCVPAGCARCTYMQSCVSRRVLVSILWQEVRFTAAAHTYHHVHLHQRGRSEGKRCKNHPCRHFPERPEAHTHTQFYTPVITMCVYCCEGRALSLYRSKRWSVSSLISCLITGCLITGSDAVPSVANVSFTTLAVL